MYCFKNQLFQLYLKQNMQETQQTTSGSYLFKDTWSECQPEDWVLFWLGVPVIFLYCPRKCQNSILKQTVSLHPFLPKFLHIINLLFVNFPFMKNNLLSEWPTQFFYHHKWTAKNLLKPNHTKNMYVWFNGFSLFPIEIQFNSRCTSSHCWKESVEIHRQSSTYSWNSAHAQKIFILPLVFKVTRRSYRKLWCDRQILENVARPWNLAYIQLFKY